MGTAPVLNEYDKPLVRRLIEKDTNYEDKFAADLSPA
jgi:hypothetical protein